MQELLGRVLVGPAGESSGEEEDAATQREASKEAWLEETEEVSRVLEASFAHSNREEGVSLAA